VTRLAVAIASSTDEHALVRAAVAGDRGAFETIYVDHAAAMFALLTRLVGPDREREDLLQEVFVRLHATLPRFRGACSLRTFLYQLASRVAIDHLRRRRTPVDELDLDGEIDPGATPAEQAQRRQDLIRAVALLARLRPKQRVAFVLHDVMGMTHDEVAVIVDAHPAATRMRVAAARRALARFAEEEQP
jgi:RNA polymerase sigma-70 factor (ECF subfamily)